VQVPATFNLKKSGGCLIILAFLQMQACGAAELTSASTDSDQKKVRQTADETLSGFERRYFQQDFHTESEAGRLSRLEQLVFGSSKSGSLESRLAALSKAVAKSSADPAEDLSASVKIDALSTPKTASPKETFDSVLSEGIKDFKAKRFHHAQNEFEHAISLNPRSPEAYADLAGALLMLGDRQGAREAFSVCYTLHPFGRLGSYAERQLVKIARTDAYEKTAPQDSPRIVERTLKTLNRQTAEQAHNFQAQAAHEANFRVSLVNKQLERLNNETQEAIDSMHSQRFHGIEQYVQELAHTNQVKSNLLRSDSRMQASRAMAGGFKSCVAVCDSSSALKNQLLQRAPQGSPRLRALGTSLYARYYGDGMPSFEEPLAVDPPPEALKATAKSLLSETRK
jgi:tetratricopeptide (TPR) repeat protein